MSPASYHTVGVQASTFMGDPRFSKQQMQAVVHVCEADPNARILGLDVKMRPVVRAKVGIPRTMRKWALLRNGDPTDAGKLKERWR